MNSIVLPKWTIASTGINSLLVTIASLYGLLSSSPYALETENWLLQARGQDIGNLLAVGVLLLSMYLIAKGSVRAYFVWLGTMFYLLYAYTIYAVAVHFNSLFLVYVAILGLTFFTLFSAINSNSIDSMTIKVNKFASYTLIVTGILFAILWLSEIIPAIISGETPQSIKDAGLWVNPIHVLDLSVVLPSFILTGYLSLKNEKLGNYLIAPWLSFSVLMGSSIVAAMIFMMKNGFNNALAPMVMVSLVVLVSAVALYQVMLSIPYDSENSAKKR